MIILGSRFQIAIVVEILGYVTSLVRQNAPPDDPLYKTFESTRPSNYLACFNSLLKVALETLLCYQS
ncbi:hypothetical protein SLE2022_332560 [Rubroshorea leprosula]